MVFVKHNQTFNPNPTLQNVAVHTTRRYPQRIRKKPQYFMVLTFKFCYYAACSDQGIYVITNNFKILKCILFQLLQLYPVVWRQSILFIDS